MPPTRNSRSDKDLGKKPELRICQESGRDYRPFIDPKRIKNSDARKVRGRHGTKGIPEIHLNIIDLTTEILSSTSRQSRLDAPAETNTSNCNCQSTHNNNDTHPDQQDFLSFDCGSSSSARSSSSSPYFTFSALPSPLPRTPIYPLSTSRSEYDVPCVSTGTTETGLTPFGHLGYGREHDFTYGRQYQPSSGRTGLNPESYNATPGRCSASLDPDNCAFDVALEDPTILAEALKIVQAMPLGEVDLGLLSLDADNRHPATTYHCNQMMDGPLRLDIYPCDFLDRHGRY